MNLNLVRVLLQYSNAITRANYCKLLVANGESFKESKRIATFARIYCTISSENSLESDESDYEFATLPVIDYGTIADNDPEKMRKLDLFQLELSFYAQVGEAVPKRLESKHWRHLLSMEFRSERHKYYKFLWKSEMRKVYEQLRKRKNFENYMLQKELRGTEVQTKTSLQYGLAKNTLLYRIYPQQVHNMYNWKLVQASVFGPDLLVDCGYEEFMNRAEISICARQIMSMWSGNRERIYPFNLIFCNYKRDGRLAERLAEIVPSLYDDQFPFTYTEKHYLDLLPKEKLVYLTPHCSETMENYESDSVYILGGVTENHRCEHVSLAKAKKEGLRMAKFPLDKYLDWGCGVKTLTLRECIGIVNELKDGHDWKVAFRHISPKRLIKQRKPSEPVDGRSLKFRIKRPRKLSREELIFQLIKGM